MTGKTRKQVPFKSEPRFLEEARGHALELARLPAEELGRLLRVNPKLAAENYWRYQDFLSPEPSGLPALLAYTGIVFKHLRPDDFTDEDFRYAQSHLLVASFLYGLLRPLDVVRCYRLEGNVRLSVHEDRTMFDYWKPLLTDYFIAAIQAQGNVLLNIASGEMRELVDWQRVSAAVQVVTPEFLVSKNGKPSTVVVYAKMCRGEMARFVLKNRIEQPEALRQFCWEGFAYDERLSKPGHPVFLLPDRKSVV